MSAGHLTLHGWALAADSFWSVDAVFYTVGVGLVGIRPLLLHPRPAFIASLVVLFGILIARETARASLHSLLQQPSSRFSPFLVDSCRISFSAGHSMWEPRCGASWPSSRFEKHASESVGRLRRYFSQAGIVGDLPARRPRSRARLPGRASRYGTGAGKRSQSPDCHGVHSERRTCSNGPETCELVGTFSIGKLQPYASHAQMLRNLKNIASGAVHMFGVESGQLSTGWGAVCTAGSTRRWHCSSDPHASPGDLALGCGLATRR